MIGFITTQEVQGKILPQLDSKIYSENRISRTYNLKIQQKSDLLSELCMAAETE